MPLTEHCRTLENLLCYYIEQPETSQRQVINRGPYA